MFMHHWLAVSGSIVSNTRVPFVNYLCENLTLVHTVNHDLRVSEISNIFESLY